MFNLKKIAIACSLSAIMVGAVTVPAFAITSYDHTPQIGRTSLQGSDSWNRGLKNGNNGWYFSYSYYYNGGYNHHSQARLNGQLSGNSAYAGSTSTAQTKSYQTTSGYMVECGHGML